ncbi:MAG: hypothetical protein NVS9B4_00240 [Candidatus Acidiferrum sp.]
MSAQEWALILPFFPEPMQALILDPTVSDICINGARDVYVERNGLMERTGLRMEAEQLNAAIEQIAYGLKQTINAEYPILDSRLPNGSRIAAMYPPCSPNGATLTIRKFTRWFTMAELIKCGTLPESITPRLLYAIINRQNVLISGSTGSGKTTILNALLRRIPEHERIIVIEKPMELDIQHGNAVRWEAVDSIARDRPGISVSQLVVAALRHRPDRIIVGEVRDHAAYDMLQAMNTGHESLSTIHAANALEALERVSTLALAAHPNLGQAFVRAQTAGAIHFVMHVARDSTGRRRVTEFLRVTGYDTARNRFECQTCY